MMPAVEFLTALWSAEPPGRLAVSWKSGNGLRTRTFTGRGEAATFAVSHKADTWIRTTTLPRDWNGNGRGVTDDATALPGLFADLDVKVEGVKDRGFDSVEDAREFLLSLPLKPSLIVKSGGGLQPWWILREPLVLDTPEDRAEAASLLRRWECFLRSQVDVDIDSVAELARILRVPGTFNHKYDPPRPVTLADVTETRYNPADFEPFLTAVTDEDRGTSSDDRTERKPTGATEMPEDLLDALSGSGKAGELWRFGKNGGKDKSVNDAALAATLGVLGFDDTAIEAALRLYKLGQIGSEKLTGTNATRQLGRLLGMAAEARANREEPQGAGTDGGTDTDAPEPDEGSCPHCGRDACEGDCTPGLRFKSAAEVMAERRPPQIVDAIAVEGGVSVLVGPPGAAKTFVLLSIAACVSDGLTWNGRAVQEGSVAYVSFEGDDLGARLTALEKAQGHRLDHLHIKRAANPLSPIVDRDQSERPSIGEQEVSAALDQLVDVLHAAGRPPVKLLVVDTVRASLSGSEDSSENVSAYLRAIRRILTHAPGAAAVLAHHAGWLDDDDAKRSRKRERGSSAFRGNCDCTLYLDPRGDDSPEIALRTLKLRDAAHPPPLRLIRRTVDLEVLDQHGNPLTSCVIDADRTTREEREAARMRTVEAEQRELDLKVLRVIAEHDVTSQQTIRQFAGVKYAAVSDALGRLLRAGWVRMPEKQREPYTVTAEGREALDGARSDE